MSTVEVADAESDRSAGSGPIRLEVDHVRMVAADPEAEAGRLVKGFGLAELGRAESDAGQLIAVGRNDVRLLITSPGLEDGATASHSRHGDGVFDIALRSRDVEADFAAAVAGGAVGVAVPSVRGGVRSATVLGVADLRHTLVERTGDADPWTLPGLGPVARPSPSGADTALVGIDHFALCVPAGELQSTADFYRRTLGLATVFTEHVVVGRQAMNSLVVQSAPGGLTLTMLEPDTSRDPGQIDAFLAGHDGAGIQHIAFSCPDIVRAVAEMSDRGVEFLTTPAAYYDQLPERMWLRRHTLAQLRDLSLLADKDHDGQLYQIFTRSTHPRGTLFFEVIERQGATTFGSGNIRALYEAVAAGRR